MTTLRFISSGSDSDIGAVLATQRSMRRGAPAPLEPIRILLVDDHAMVRQGLRLILDAAPDMKVVGEAENGVAAVALAERLEPDIVVLDLEMPGGGGRTALDHLSRAVPNARVLIVTVHREDELLLQLLQAGARGYLSKEAAAHELVEALRVVADGEVYVRPDVARMLAGAIGRGPAHAGPRDRYDSLSLREQAILRQIAEGYSGAEVARRLGISRKTVDTYKRRIQDKLGIAHRTEYVRFAVDAGLLPRDGERGR